MRRVVALAALAACLLAVGGCATDNNPSRERNVAGAASEDMEGPFTPAYQLPFDIYMR